MNVFTQAKNHSPRQDRNLSRLLLLMLLLFGSSYEAQAATNYNSTVTTQVSTSAVTAGTNGVQMIRIAVTYTGNNSTIALTSLTIATSGTTSTSDIQNMKVYYTGTSSTFATTTQFGSTVASPGASHIFTGSNSVSTGGTHYYWVTYDVKSSALTGNLIDAAITGHTIDGTARTLTTAEGNPSGSRAIGSAMSGTYTIGGTSPDFGSFTAAVANLISRGVSGPVTFNARDGSYNEQISISVITGASSSNTITFQSQSLDSTKVLLWYASGATNNYAVDLNGANYITFRKLSFQRTGAGTTGNVLSFANASTNNKIQSCRLRGVTTTTNGSALAVVFSSGTQDNNNEFSNNSIKQGSYGFYWYGTSTAARETGTVISSNSFDSTYIAAMELSFQTGATISENVITNIKSASAGIYLVSGGSGNSVQRNRLNLPTGQYGIYFNATSGAAGSPSVIANNMVSLGGTAVSYGIYMISSGTANIYYNSVNVYNTNSASAGFYANNGSGTLVLNNNNLANTGGGYAIQTYNTTTFTSNYNNLYVTGSNLGNTSGTNRASLAAWRTATSQDANSLSVNPFFASSTDLTSSNCALKNTGTNLSISTDIDGTARDATPDIGAKELSLAFSTGRWTGASSTAWATTTNWCDGTLPTSTTDVTIPAINVTNMPTHSTGSGATRNLTIETGATLTVSGGTLSIHESLTKNGTLTHTGGIIEFANTGAQQNIPAGTYFNLKVSGTGDKMLLGNVTVNNNLDISGGFLETGLYIVMLGSSATLTETGTTYVKGVVTTTRTISSVGTPETFGGLGLSITAGNASRLPGSTVVTRYTDRQLGTQYLQGGTPRLGMTRAFDIVPATNGGLNATLAFSYNDDDLNAIDEQHLYFYRAPHSAGATFLYQGRTSLDIPNNLMTLSGIDSFSVWTGGGTNGGLPVALTSFTASVERTAVTLRWETASEENNDFFAVERSLDGRSWLEIGRVTGSGTTNTLRAYAYLDPEAASLLSSTLYYRLRQVDYNGQHEYSPIRIVRRAGELGNGHLHAFYDASTESLRATLTGRDGRSQSIVLTDALGRVLATRQISSSKVEMSLQGLPKGFYTLRLESGESARIMKN